MDKAFYVTDSHVQLIDLIKLQHGEQYLLDTVNLTNEKAIEEMLLTLNKKQTFVIILDLIDEVVDFNWSYKLMPWEKVSYEKQIKDKFDNESGEFIKIIWQNQFQKNIHNVTEQMIMIVSINKNKQLKQFLLMLEDAQMSVVAIYSYQLLLQKYFFKKIVPKLNFSKNKIKNPFLLVFQEDKYNFKQFFFHNGNLRLVRNIEVAEEITVEEDIIDSLISESLSMVKYMYNQKTLPFNSEVGLIYIGLDTFKDINVIDKFQKKMPYVSSATEGLQKKSTYNHLNLSSIVNNNQKNTSLKPLDFLVNYLAKTTITTFYTNKFINKINLFINIGKSLIFLIFLILFVGTTYLIHFGISNYLIKENTVHLDQQLSVLQTEKNNLQQTIQLELDAEDMKASVDFSEAILKFKDEKRLEFFLKHLSVVLADHENIIISQLSWNKKQYWDDRVMIFLFEGWVFPFNNSYQQPVEWVDKLIIELHNLPGFMEISLLKEPLNRDLQQTISISADDLQQVVALPFSLSITVGEIDVNTK